MTPIENFLERAFASYDDVLQKLSLRWQKHANRRTIIILVLAGSVLTFLYVSIIRPPDNFPLETLVTIEDGTSANSVGVALEQLGVVRSSDAFRLLVVFLGYEKDIHAGDYLFKEPRDLFSVVRAVSIGAYGLEPMKIRVPEGATTKEMALLFGARLLRFNTERFISLSQPSEGYLFPDTYYFLPNATEDLVVRTMRQNFDSRLLEIRDQIDAFGAPLADVITMASLLEREARVMQDRRTIAGVLWNRLSRGMLLQVDAAFLYTLGKGTYQLTTKDLMSDSPYNTYRNVGLPPTPIGSPSLDSILAAVTPINHNYLYYLADRSGVTHYSKTYAEHLRLKRKYID
jgi:UPF0755 protein